MIIIARTRARVENPIEGGEAFCKAAECAACALARLNARCKVAKFVAAARQSSARTHGVTHSCARVVLALSIALYLCYPNASTRVTHSPRMRARGVCDTREISRAEARSPHLVVRQDRSGSDPREIRRSAGKLKFNENQPRTKPGRARETERTRLLEPCWFLR